MLQISRLQLPETYLLTLFPLLRERKNVNPCHVMLYTGTSLPFVILCNDFQALFVILCITESLISTLIPRYTPLCRNHPGTVYGFNFKRCNRVPQTSFADFSFRSRTRSIFLRPGQLPETIFQCIIFIDKDYACMMKEVHLWQHRVFWNISQSIIPISWRCMQITWMHLPEFQL